MKPRGAPLDPECGWISVLCFKCAQLPTFWSKLWWNRGENRIFSSFLWQSAHSFHLLNELFTRMISLVFVFRSWSQRLNFAENWAFIIWIKKNLLRKPCPWPAPCRTERWAQLLVVMWSTRGFIFVHWVGVFFFFSEAPSSSHTTPKHN